MSINTFSPERIFLIGLPGVGKTTLGRALAEELGWLFADLDAEIERAAGRSVGALFEEEGEEFFRRQEAAVLRQVGRAVPLVLATGGGTPCFHDSLDWLLAHGAVVWLDVEPAIIVGRLLTPMALPVGSRPLLAAAAAASPQATAKALLGLLTQTLAAREVYYTRAPHRLAGPDLAVGPLRALLGR